MGPPPCSSGPPVTPPRPLMLAGKSSEKGREEEGKGQLVRPERQRKGAKTAPDAPLQAPWEETHVPEVTGMAASRFPGADAQPPPRFPTRASRLES